MKSNFAATSCTGSPRLKRMCRACRPFALPRQNAEYSRKKARHLWPRRHVVAFVQHPRRRNTSPLSLAKTWAAAVRGTPFPVRLLISTSLVKAAPSAWLQTGFEGLITVTIHTSLTAGGFGRRRSFLVLAYDRRLPSKRLRPAGSIGRTTNCGKIDASRCLQGIWSCWLGMGLSGDPSYPVWRETLGLSSPAKRFVKLGRNIRSVPRFRDCHPSVAIWPVRRPPCQKRSYSCVDLLLVF